VFFYIINGVNGFMRSDRHDLPMIAVIDFFFPYSLLIVATLLLGFQFKVYLNFPLPYLFEIFERFDLGLFVRLIVFSIFFLIFVYGL
jgi:hypothetical protein